MLKPLGNRVLLEVVEEEATTISSIVLPESAKDKPQFAKVVAVGEGKLLESGDRLPLEVKVGDKVLFEKYAGNEVKYQGTEYLILKDTDIVAIAE